MTPFGDGLPTLNPCAMCHHDSENHGCRGASIEATLELWVSSPAGGEETDDAMAPTGSSGRGYLACGAWHGVSRPANASGGLIRRPVFDRQRVDQAECTVVRHQHCSETEGVRGDEQIERCEDLAMTRHISPNGST